MDCWQVINLLINYLICHRMWLVVDQKNSTLLKQLKELLCPLSHLIFNRTYHQVL